MLPIPEETLKPFDALMEKKSILPRLRPDFRKWLRYFLDFQAKYQPPDSRSEQVRLFIEKLKSKGQSQQQLNEAAQALSLFYATQAKAIPASGKQGNGKSRCSPASPPPCSLRTNLKEEKGGGRALVVGARTSSEADKQTPRPGRRYDEMRFRTKTNSPEWDKIIEKLEAEISTRHYSRKTLITYANWIRKFQHY